MSDKKNNQTDHATVKPTKRVSTAMDSETTAEIERPKKKRRSGPLTLDNDAQRPAKTRTALYNELSKDEKAMGDEDYYEFSHPVVRGLALIIDAMFAVMVVRTAIFISPIEVKLAHSLFLDKYHLQFMFGEKLTHSLFAAGTVFLALFFLIVIPVAFFNVSLGKKLTKQRVRGDGAYTITISQAFQRELIYKPVSIACLVGFILPFFDKKKKSLHDKLAGTLVIKE